MVNKTIRLRLFKPMAPIGLVLFFFFAVCPKMYAQGNLSRTVSITNTGRIRLGALLTKISSELQFNFAYNNRDVAADSTVLITAYTGHLEDFLYHLLGDDYEFREEPGYIIIRYARGRLSIKAEITTDLGDSLLIKGYVSDARTDEMVRNACINVKNQLISTNTDEHGDFLLKITKDDAALILTASKENYHDASLYLLKGVNIMAAKEKGRYKYDPKVKAKTQTKRSGFSRFFINSRKSTGGYAGGVQGLEFAGLFNIDQSDVSSLPAPRDSNIVDSNLKDVQLAAIDKQVSNTTSGGKAPGKANVKNNISIGLQVAGLANVSDTAADFQASALLNKATKVKHVQLALINIADSSDYSIGVVNLVKNGEKGVALSGDETSFTHLDFRSGSKILYGLVGIGYNFNDSPCKLAVDFGLGGHLISGKHFRFDTEYVNQEFYGNDKKDYQVNTIKALLCYKLDRHFRLFAGPGLNLVSSAVENGLNVTGWVIHRQESNNNLTVLSSGITYGLQYNW